ncbi:hypothetical protein M9H77_08335 [Catharanthus roseus]|uniref:Uncharacterized protein n=1 Tax=Catharanthus roseus TaxID=4058 RepID=A0ACC0BXM5_CATRO|nr:hypothetical protein M9H77_08335 [Catharanthus roseus]
MAWERGDNSKILPQHVQEISNSVDSGHARLHELGYKQELKRDLSVLSNFAFSFSIISVLTGVTTLYNTGLNFGGPVSLVYGWLLAGSFTMFVGLSMAEICSSYPTSGGLYYWSAKLAGPVWAPFASWMTGWFNIVGQWAVTTSVDFSLAQLIQVIILLSTGGSNGGGYEASKYVVIGIHGAILLLHAILNSLPISWLSFFGQLAAAWNVLGVFVLMIVIPTVATEKASAKFVFTHFNTDNGEGISGKLYIFVLGLLMSQYTLSGYDASAHMNCDADYMLPTTRHLSGAEFPLSCKNCDADYMLPITGISVMLFLRISVLKLMVKDKYSNFRRYYSAEKTEETKSADVNGPKGIISSIGISIVVGWGYILGITFAVTNIPHLLSTENDAGGYAIAQVFYEVFKRRYGSGVGGIICLGIIAVAIFFCGMSSVTSNSSLLAAW